MFASLAAAKTILTLLGSKERHQISPNIHNQIEVNSLTCKYSRRFDRCKTLILQILNFNCS